MCNVVSEDVRVFKPEYLVVYVSAFVAGEADVTFRVPVPGGSLYVEEYLVDGVDVLGGVPTLQHLQVTFGDGMMSNEPILGNTSTGFILPLTGQRSHVIYPHGRRVGKLPPQGRNTRIVVRSPTGTVPTITSLYLYLRVEPSQ